MLCGVCLLLLPVRPLGNDLILHQHAGKVTTVRQHLGSRTCACAHMSMIGHACDLCVWGGGGKASSQRFQGQMQQQVQVWRGMTFKLMYTLACRLQVATVAAGTHCRWVQARIHCTASLPAADVPLAWHWQGAWRAVPMLWAPLDRARESCGP